MPYVNVEIDFDDLQSEIVDYIQLKIKRSPSFKREILSAIAFEIPDLSKTEVVQTLLDSSDKLRMSNAVNLASRLDEIRSAIN